MMVCRALLIGIMGISPALAQEAAGWCTDGHAPLLHRRMT